MFSDPAKRRDEFRPIILSGHKSTGKTTFAVSASKHAPDELKPQNPSIACPDVALLSFDHSGEDGARSFGLEPRVIAFDGCVGWSEQKAKLCDAVKFLRPLVENGDVTAIGIDLGAVDAAVQSWATGEDSADLRSPKPKSSNGQDIKPNWQRVTAEGLWLFHFLSQLQCSVIAMTHLKARDHNAFADQLPAAKLEKKKVADAAMAYAGLPAVQTADCVKGILRPWLFATSFQLATRVENVDGGTPLKPTRVRKYCVITDGDDLVEAGTRFRDRLPKIWTGSLHSLLNTAYNVKAA